MYTQCPNCETHFEITQEYLDMANGKVRCGQCEHIFNALENLYEKPPETEASADDSSVESPVVSTAQSQVDTAPTPTSDADTSNQWSSTSPETASYSIKEKMERIAASLSAATQELKTARESTKFGASNFLNNTSDTSSIRTTASPFSAFHKEEPKPLEDETDITEPTSVEDELDIAEPALVEDELDIAEPAPVEDELDIAEPAPTEDELDIAEPALVEEESGIPELDELDFMEFDQEEDSSDSTTLTDFSTRKVDQDDLDILNSLIAETGTQNQRTDDYLLDELDNLNSTLSDEDNSLSDSMGSLDDEFDDLDSGDDLLAELEQLEKDFINNEQPSSRSPDTSLDDELDDELDENTQDEIEIDSITPEPNEVSSVASNKPEEVVPSFLTQDDAITSNPGSMFGWLAGTLVLLITLFAQYMHVNSVDYAQNTTFRPILETLCPITGCELPLIKAPRNIVTVNHDVRTHPGVNNALEIQLTFKNKAPFTQGYPLLEVIFSNPRGEVVARRRFSPAEYLTADIQYAYGLKQDQSQDVRLKIVDPDPGALLSFQFNYF